MEDIKLDELAIHWREALDAADDSLDELGRNRRLLQIPPAELHNRHDKLAGERGLIELDLEELARTTHSHLHRHLSGPRATSALLGLGADVRGCVFDLDGVLTASTSLHAAAWQKTFDELLARRHRVAGEQFGPWRPFARRPDYARYLQGKPRIDGVHAFLASRAISLPDGDPADPPGTETAFGLANRKQQVLKRRLSHEGVRGYLGSALFLELAGEAELRCAVVSASANTNEILRRAGLLFLLDAVVDGNVMAAARLRPKPAPDSIEAACCRLDLDPESVAAFETTTAGIAASRAAGVARIVAVDRGGRAATFAALGVDRVVADLGELIDPALG